MSEIIINDSCIDLLMQSKQLVHTSYEVTAIQNRIFYYCLLTAQKEKNGELSCTVKLEDIKKLIPNKNQRTLANIKKTIQILKQTSLEFEKREDGDTIECDYNLIAGSEYNVNKETFKIKLADRLYRHLIDYTVYAPLNLEILTKFKSFYAQRLYELLRLWSRTDTPIIKSFKIEQLRFVLGVENKYPAYKNFKQRVLNQAVKEINQVGNMKVDIEEVKSGRRVDEIKFMIFDYEKKVYFKKNVQSSIVSNDDLKETKEIEPVNKNENEEIKDFYIPNKKLFTAKTLDNFKKDFSNYDFKDSTYKKLLQEAILVALEKDDEEKIKVKSYNYFKKTLENKINDIQNKKDKPKSVNTRFHNINQSFNKYNAEELERMLIENQKSKFEVHSNSSNEDIISDNWKLDEDKIG
ncbi:RepB family plasmid replication initiator protein [Paeniclostridium sordellii]|uniref:replication initiation protein n=3 Tax=Clostridia TaxID=186801 RepID=UPI0012B0E23B|nr:replication initiation protein [Paeniclostridium sordellii]MDU4415250.1 replication initiation protein [Paeniclostridium sordellii]MRZ27979.1 RepB family plasmid replication initiator protein [Paeniclostridium sordellii]